MKEKQSALRKWTKRIALALATLVAASIIGFLIYASGYYRAQQSATAVLQSSKVSVEGKVTTLRPDAPSDTALIFYPGGKVEHSAYLPLLEQLSQRGITCFLVKMPYNLAVFDSDAGTKIMQAHPEISNWYIGGHSLGGAMASSYAAKNQDKVEGLILLGAYIYGEYPPEKALIVYGSQDLGLDRSKITYQDNVFEIPGGNHAQFGNYGSQKGDGEATMSAQEQQNIAADYIEKFIKE